MSFNCISKGYSGRQFTENWESYSNNNYRILWKDEYMSVDEIYKRLSNQNSSFNTKQIENSIAYAINIRNANTSKTNFKKIFGYEYDIYCFTNKNLIEELVRIIKNSPDKG